jgi:hypothetical protein
MICAESELFVSKPQFTWHNSSHKGLTARLGGQLLHAAGIHSAGGIPVIVDSVDSMTIKPKGRNTPGPINLQFTDVEPQMTSICGTDVHWHADQETLPAAETECGGGNKSSYIAKAMYGNLQDQRNFSLDPCEFKEFQLQLRSDDGGDGGNCNLLPKGAACDNDGQCCSGKCKGPEGGKTCK